MQVNRSDVSIELELPVKEASSTLAVPAATTVGGRSLMDGDRFAPPLHPSPLRWRWPWPTPGHGEGGAHMSEPSRTSQSLVVSLAALTVVSGFLDSVSYLGLGHVFTANMTGNVAPPRASPWPARPGSP